jgi:GxxExxY protein
MELEHKEITEQIIGAAFEIYKVLGYGFLEKVYQRAMQVELRLRGLKAEIEQKIKVLFKGTVVGDYQADVTVADVVIVELKVEKTCNSDDERQLLNEFRATATKVGLLVNFGRTKVEFKSLVF